MAVESKKSEEYSNERNLKRMDFGEKLQKGLSHLDSWSNNVTGLGTAFDKAKHTQFNRTVRIPDQVLSDRFHGDDITRRVVCIKPREMLRKDYIIKIPEKESGVEEALLEDRKRLDVNKKFREGLTWGGLFGGAAAVLGIDDGKDSEEPVDEASIKRIDFINIVDKRYLRPTKWQDDPMKPHFGEPEVYSIQPRTSVGVIKGATTVEVHRSRLILFPGVLTTDDERANNDSWDFSMLQTIDAVIKDFQSIWLAVGNLIQEASVGVYKVKDLIGLIASKQQDVVTQRLQMIDISKSVARSIAIDADNEDYTRIGAQMNELARLLDRYMLRLSSAVEIPVTILMGQSPAGMNATGDSDFRWFYDNIETDQKNILKPLLTKFYRYVFLAKEGPTSGVLPEAFDIEFNPLWASTPLEQAEIEKLVAEKDHIYKEDQVLDNDEIAINRFTPNGYRTTTEINRDSRIESLKAKERASELKLTLAPEDVAKVVFVNEARSSLGLKDAPNPEDGAKTVFAFAESSKPAPVAPMAPEAIGAGPGAPEEEEPKTPRAPNPATARVEEENSDG